MTPRVLMVVPTLGRRIAHLTLCLESITSQDVPGLDLLLVAPPSPEVEALAERFGARLLPDPGSGMSGALNAGFAAAATGTPYVGWLGDDDLLSPGSLAATTSALDADPGASMAFGWCDYVDDVGTVIFASRAGRLAGRSIAFAPNLVPQPGSLMRLPDVQAAGGLDEALTYSMDLDLFLRLRRRGRLLALPRTVASFRWHPDSITVQSETASAEEADQVRMRYMARPVAACYQVARWPGRWALRVVKWRVRGRLRRARG
ncbi:MAG TPA: glycosyltransferase [Nocardioides sp.]|jgi:GT2 family glycosyltransferase|uniref:glycosyltransferase family 2 protein n=1 Tax=Nocardioides sp. TaxID=35761 RepID=UPI002E322DED|nr:glycosyltransferase [Nocardioides sp.]HEX3930713.1 glycosyltransferase [Nocardioides sp.]